MAANKPDYWARDLGSIVAHVYRWANGATAILIATADYGRAHREVIEAVAAVAGFPAALVAMGGYVPTIEKLRTGPVESAMATIAISGEHVEIRSERISEERLAVLLNQYPQAKAS